MNGLTTVNVELTSRCNKNCHMCGRRKIDKEYPKITTRYGDMDFELAKSISFMLPSNIVTQFHWNGETLLYLKLGEVLKEFRSQIRCLNTNGKLLLEKADEIIDNLETLTISVIENDPDGDEQYEIVKEFLKIKGDRKPQLIFRCLGDVDTERWKELDGLVVERVLHNPMGSFQYKKKPVIPEIGICWDFLGHLAIDRFGNVSPCVRFDPDKIHIIGNLNDNSLYEIWNGTKRKEWLEYHISMQRHKIPMCDKCHFWGVPRG